MARSLKKGPFIHYKLQKKIDEMTASGKNSVIKTWSRASLISPDLLVKLLLFIMVDSSFLYSLQKIWLAIS